MPPAYVKPYVKRQKILTNWITASVPVVNRLRR
jgi:hypothetical protein